MNLLSLSTMVAISTSTLGADPLPERSSMLEARLQAKEEMNKLQGTWVSVAIEEDGKEVPVRGNEWQAIYEGDLLTLKKAGKVFRYTVITLDPSQSPKASNDWDMDGPFKDKTVPGIYELDGDTLRVCFARPGKARPKAFTTKEGTGFLSIVYKRR